jgi:FeS assembly protein IscX
MDPLYWDDAYAIALALLERHPRVDPLDLDLEIIYQWVIELSDFADEPALKHRGWLRDIQKEWYEEVSGR